jgi:rRNA maturation endonuclease Nob1
MSETVRRCLGCQATYPPDDHACPECGSHAGYVDQVEAAEAKAEDPAAPARPARPPRRRKT